ncbi:hypothetical protein QIS99_30635 [Streptomyces sp. B-S-A8]|uniref:ESX-1 secretion-associated protein n=1 Tax=Streptomyces solicavernae TaxID=3043614 RepID=A0ABT6S241_9ACTN|nr:hypothetical protein [Streptomyces sp. B-S-A8]MDI3390519.1 hypothetical protein [Streptomyces sp. B-S-A8]
MTDGSGFAADPHSMDGSAHLLTEIAGLLHEGRLDADLGTLARTPTAHAELGAKTEEFARHAADQHRDLVTLLTALSTALRTTGGAYTHVDRATRDGFKSFLDTAELGK